MAATRQTVLHDRLQLPERFRHRDARARPELRDLGAPEATALAVPVIEGQFFGAHTRPASTVCRRGQLCRNQIAPLQRTPVTSNHPISSVSASAPANSQSSFSGPREQVRTNNARPFW